MGRNHLHRPTMNILFFLMLLTAVSSDITKEMAGNCWADLILDKEGKNAVDFIKAVGTNTTCHFSFSLSIEVQDHKSIFFDKKMPCPLLSRNGGHQPELDSWRIVLICDDPVSWLSSRWVKFDQKNCPKSAVFTTKPPERNEPESVTDIATQATTLTSDKDMVQKASDKRVNNYAKQFMFMTCALGILGLLCSALIIYVVVLRMNINALHSSFKQGKTDDNLTQREGDSSTAFSRSPQQQSGVKFAEQESMMHPVAGERQYANLNVSFDNYRPPELVDNEDPIYSEVVLPHLQWR